MHIVFARLSLTYLIASVVYLLATSCIGTPFADSLSAEQRAIKRKSSRQRAIIFGTAFLTAAVAVAVAKPFAYAAH